MSINLKLNVLKLQQSTKNCTSTAFKYFIAYSNRIPIINIYFEQYIQQFVQLWTYFKILHDFSICLIRHN